MNKYKYWGGGECLTSSSFNIQRFAYKEVTNPYNFQATKRAYYAKADLSSSMIDLTDYFRDKYGDSATFTQIPQEDLDYFKSGIVSACRSMFFNCGNLQYIPNDLGLQFSSDLWYDLSYMFSGDIVRGLSYSLDITTLDISYLPDDRILAISNMFSGDKKLKTITGLNSLKLENCFSINSLFESCESLENVDISNWNTSGIYDDHGLFLLYNIGYVVSDGMFDGCFSLKSINGLYGIKETVNNSTKHGLRYMFRNCKSLESIDLAGWDTSKITNFSDTFNGCTNLREINGVIDMSLAENYLNMFNNTNNLSGVRIKNPPADFESVARISSNQYEIVY